MNEQQAKKEMERLSALIAYHNKLYYEDARPEISDYEFDQLLEKLTKLEQDFPLLKLANSPTQRVGGTPTKNFETVYHQYPMLSLSNTYSAEEVKQFVERVQKQLPGATIAFFCELKFDGVALSLLYQDGKLAKIVTRGDGIQGDDITENGKQIPNIPLVIKGNNIPANFEVRGEAFIPLADFEQLNQARLSQGLEPLANPRNATAGTLKTLKNQAGPKRLLDCYMYALFIPGAELPTHEMGIQKLAQWGFPISPTYKKCLTLEEILDYIAYWEKAKQALPLAIDGVVIKVNDIFQQNKLGLTAKSPRWAIAYKYKPESLATLLEFVDYQVGRTGIITPVAHLVPIFLAGTIVKRATLHNASEIQRLDLHLGDTVLIEKGGEIIPKITGVDTTKRKPDSQPVAFISHCPACGTALVKRYHKGIYCPNIKSCPYQLQGLLRHFVHRKAMDIRSIGKQTIALLVKHGLVHNPADLYTLRYEDIRSLEGFKDLSTQHILDGIKHSKQRPYERVLFALGIRHVGEVIASKVAQYYTNIDSLAQATPPELMAIPFIGEEIAHSIVNYFENPVNLQLIVSLRQAGLQLSKPTTHVTNQTLPLSGKNFLISGTFQQLEREALKDLIKEKGGNLLTSVSTKLDYLVAGHNPGPSKMEQAQTMGILIIDEPQILHMLQS